MSPSTFILLRVIALAGDKDKRDDRHDYALFNEHRAFLFFIWEGLDEVATVVVECNRNDRKEQHTATAVTR